MGSFCISVGYVRLQKVRFSLVAKGIVRTQPTRVSDQLNGSAPGQHDGDDDGDDDTSQWVYHEDDCARA